MIVDLQRSGDGWLADYVEQEAEQVVAGGCDHSTVCETGRADVPGCEDDVGMDGVILAENTHREPSRVSGATAQALIAVRSQFSRPRGRRALVVAIGSSR
ncbi:hypothetical protein GCM10009629_53560 [Pseudonocardia alni]